jgi:hypothetical protein
MRLTLTAGNKFQVNGLTPSANVGVTSPGIIGGGDVSGNTLTFEISFPQTAAINNDAIVSEANVVDLSGLQLALANISITKIYVNDNITIPQNNDITIPQNVTVIVAANKTLTVNSKLTVLGTIKSGTEVSSLRIRLAMLGTADVPLALPSDSPIPKITMGMSGSLDAEAGSSLQFNNFSDIFLREISQD